MVQLSRELGTSPTAVGQSGLLAEKVVLESNVIRSMPEYLKFKIVPYPCPALHGNRLFIESAAHLWKEE